MDRIDKAGIYVHIPFCRSKCPYCDFYSLPSKKCDDEYVDAVCDEMKNLSRMKAFIPKGEKISADTLYFGGGTPSLLSAAQLENLINTARESFFLGDDSEITLECNPSSENLGEFLKSAASFGVNRISLGMQSSSDRERRMLGRKGGTDSIAAAVNAAEKAGIDNISLDIMVGVPESNIGTLRESLDFAATLGASHISAYILKIEEGTYYYRNREKLKLPDEDETADMYLFMSQYLKEKGYFHYEVSNFCKDGAYSRHNMKYWDMIPYLGFGPGAHSFYGGKRFYFPRDIHSFIEGKPCEYDGEGGDDEEKLLLSLRTYKGISLTDKSPQFIEKARFFEKNGFAQINGDNFSLLDKGYLLSNSIISELLMY
ncbi:MAG: radical SAM family heme chaperone HemW [Ruminococcaceae bacterium]|nr:radical SAM family heme chaperone HemW [Oscillospiraceae bacterium]